MREAQAACVACEALQGLVGQASAVEGLEEAVREVDSALRARRSFVENQVRAGQPLSPLL